jgi:alginate O-acetyltransferase complex protein AlgJ
MSRLSLTRRPLRLIVGAMLALLPLLSAWNLSMPKRQVQIGPTLGGVTNQMPVIFSWSAIRDGSFQKAVASRVTEAFALRPVLIRVNNEVRMELFGELTAPHVVRGAKGQLIERSYLEDYCSRTEGMGAELAAKNIPKLRDIQSYYRGRGGLFVYLLSPSKAAHLPEYFVDKLPCPSTPAARAKFVGEYVAALRQAGIDVVDTATLIHSLKGAYDFDLFPQGGVHWNDVGGARAVSVLVDEINRQAGQNIVPSFTFTYTLSSAAGADRELVDLLNVFFPPLAYMTPKVKYTTAASCAEHPARLLDVAMVGSSFSHLPANILIQHNCLSRLNFYYYARLGRFGGVPYRELQRNLVETDLLHFRDATIMILEENEAFAARNGYVDILRDIVTKP